ncbi:BTB/POZ domain-containing protein 2-like [Paramacrobiotus metropolitanus]|uniref:BTB/POZ domain-containing protein 2-like n=1 Tax=Paramacrobiotus metropolitanus TaxID=2943436 RepID=UPI0024463DEC|nr:BTB/POZ domain-containing protein 2-like [Paramacrobiotus metropolitanus]
MFYGSSPVKCATAIDIPDVLPAAFARMLEYIYTDAVNVTIDDVFPTMQCADKYDLPRLADRCYDFILKDLRINNCLLHALDWSIDSDPDNSIVENCLHFVDLNGQEVFDTESERFAQLKHRTVRRILERATLQADDTLIYAAVDKWAMAACARNNLDPSAANRRKVLGDVLYLIRFPLMTDKQLADGPAGSGLLSPSELLEIHLYKHATTKRPVQFATHPRHPPLIHVGDTTFEDSEEVFLEDLVRHI